MISRDDTRYKHALMDVNFNEEELATLISADPLFLNGYCIEDDDDHDDDSNITALAFAAGKGATKDNPVTVSFLIKNGSLLNEDGPYDNSPLNEAVYHGNVNCVSTLLRAGAKRCYNRDVWGTPLVSFFTGNSPNNHYKAKALNVLLDPEICQDPPEPVGADVFKEYLRCSAGIQLIDTSAPAIQCGFRLLDAMPASEVIKLQQEFDISLYESTVKDIQADISARIKALTMDYLSLYSEKNILMSIISYSVPAWFVHRVKDEVHSVLVQIRKSNELRPAIQQSYTTSGLTLFSSGRGVKRKMCAEATLPSNLPH